MYLYNYVIVGSEIILIILFVTFILIIFRLFIYLQTHNKINVLFSVKYSILLLKWIYLDLLLILGTLKFLS